MLLSATYTGHVLKFVQVRKNEIQEVSKHFQYHICIRELKDYKAEKKA